MPKPPRSVPVKGSRVDPLFARRTEDRRSVGNYRLSIKRSANECHEMPRRIKVRHHIDAVENIVKEGASVRFEENSSVEEVRRWVNDWGATCKNPGVAQR